MASIFEHYKAIIHGATNPVVIEIGAADGGDTVHLLQPLIESGRDYRLLAFECEKKNFPKFKAKNLAVEFFEMAVGNKCGPHRFVGSGSWPYSGSLKEPKLHRISHAWIPFEEPTEVPCVTLDSVFQSCRLDHCDFLWVDVQGAEDLVVEGGQTALAKTHWLWVEVYEAEEYEGHIGRDELLKRLPGDWEITEIHGTDILYRNRDFQ